MYVQGFNITHISTHFNLKANNKDKLKAQVHDVTLGLGLSSTLGVLGLLHIMSPSLESLEVTPCNLNR